MSVLLVGVINSGLHWLTVLSLFSFLCLILSHPKFVTFFMLHTQAPQRKESWSSLIHYLAPQIECACWSPKNLCKLEVLIQKIWGEAGNSSRWYWCCWSMDCTLRSKGTKSRSLCKECSKLVARGFLGPRAGLWLSLQRTSALPMPCPAQGGIEELLGRDGHAHICVLRRYENYQTLKTHFLCLPPYYQWHASIVHLGNVLVTA